MKAILKVRLEIIDHFILFQILGQNDDYIQRGAGELFKASNNISIRSDDAPAISSKTIWLQGRDSALNVRPLLYWAGESEAEVARMLQEIVYALNEFACKFTTKADEEELTNPHIYLFYPS